MCPKNSIVVYLDILGYQSFLKNNNKLRDMEEVLDLINSIDETIKERIESDDMAAPIEEFPGESQVTVFSDTIVMTFPETDHWSWFLALLKTTVVYSEMFNYGLPVRGAIAYGEIARNGASFAGAPFAAAHQLAAKVNGAFCVIDLSAQSAMEDLRKLEPESDEWNVIDGFLMDYLIPTKEGAFRGQVVRYSQDDMDDLRGDITQFVADAFWKHGKDISPNVYPKLQNTEMFFRFLMRSQENPRERAARRRQARDEKRDADMNALLREIQKLNDKP